MPMPYELLSPQLQALVAAAGLATCSLMDVGQARASAAAPEAEPVTRSAAAEPQRARLLLLQTDLSVLDVAGEALVVSQFTLYADTRKGRRPSFTDAALPAQAEPLVERFIELLRQHRVPTLAGRFGEHMLVEIHNNGPVTLWLEG